ncbi:MAG: hypothetical protein FWF15_11440 [Oscillospiraceae bacterium]|nr:hypothetical protein [Oscillospiraceae bacterium]
MRKIVTPAQLSRKFAMIMYITFAVMFLFAMHECFVNKTYFHIPLFSFFIISFLIGLLSAIKFKFSLETRVLYVNIAIIIFCISSNLLFVMELVPKASFIRTMLILVLMLIYLFYRLTVINWLKQEAALMMKEVESL